jgi:formylglycine-generating enzyme required for sulfatase activity
MGTTKGQVDTLLTQFPDVKREFYNDEQPDHRVTILRPFYLGAHEVTVGQFKQFVEAKDYKTDREKVGSGDNWRSPGFTQDKSHPVVYVSHHDALAFCAWLNVQEKGTGWTYRLPTEAEWEYACRAGTGGLYGGSDDPATLDRVAWYSKNTGRGTQPVGKKQENAFGLYDMLGNVWEWCDDTSGAPDRVLRGGSWDLEPRDCRPARRSRSAPDARYSNLGFRVAAVRD